MRGALVSTVLAVVWVGGVLAGDAVGDSSAAADRPHVGGAVVAAGASADPVQLYAPHRRAGRFFNPWTDDDRSLWRLVRWQLLSRNRYDKSREPRVPVVPNDGVAFAEALPDGEAEVTWVGHATFAVRDGDDVFLTDPHFGPRALIPRREVEPGIPLASVPANAFAVLSHSHYDHLDASTVDALPDSIQWFVPLGMAEWFRRRGRDLVVELDWWERVRRGRWSLTCLPSQHGSRRLGQATDEALWCAWLLDSGTRRYFFAGDTGYFHGFREFGARFGPIDVAMLPIGGYEPRWFMRSQHMSPAEALQAFLDLRARLLLPMHWGTFDLTDEPVDQPPHVLARVLAERGPGRAEVRTLAIGESLRLPSGARE